MWLVVLAALIRPPASSSAQPALLVGPYLQDVRQDGFTVVAETAAPSAVGLVLDDGRRFAGAAGTRHELTAAGLEPGRRYGYRVLVDGVEAARADAVTAPLAQERLTFVVYGDTRQGTVERELSSAILAEAPDLLLHTGDLVPSGDDEAAWRQFFRAEDGLLARVPIYPVAGNHELYHDPAADHFRRYFVLPDQGRDRRYYSFRFASARFIILDGNSPGDSAQTAWLAQTLEHSEVESGTRHVFVVVHQPPFSVGEHCGAAVEQAAWVSLFERYRVRAVFAGHDHAYERLERLGVRYFISGGGGAPLYAESTVCPPFDRAARRIYKSEYHFLRVRVVGDAVDVAALTLPGAPIETVAWKASDTLIAAMAPPLEVPRTKGVSSRAGLLLAGLVGLGLSGLAWLTRRRPARAVRS